MDIRQLQYLVALAREQHGQPDYAKEASDNADFLVQRYPEKELLPPLRSEAALPLALRADAELLLGQTSKARDDAYLATLADPRCAAAGIRATMTAPSVSHDQTLLFRIASSSPAHSWLQPERVAARPLFVTIGASGSTDSRCLGPICDSRPVQSAGGSL